MEQLDTNMTAQQAHFSSLISTISSSSSGTCRKISITNRRISSNSSSSRYSCRRRLR
jgi:hypothetical protein